MMARKPDSNRSAAIAIGFVLLLSVASCAREHDPSMDPPVTPRGPSSPAMAEPSIYDLDIPLVESDGRAVALSDLRGRTVVATMIYTSCTSVCPRVTEDMKTIERRLPARARDAMTFALFSLDPARDTPQALHRFAAERHLGSGWRLFAASEDSVRTLAAMLGVKYAGEPSGEIAHSALIAVIDRDGVVRHRQVGLDTGPDAIVRSVLATF